MNRLLLLHNNMLEKNLNMKKPSSKEQTYFKVRIIDEQLI